MMNYPNNSFVARLAARFDKEVTASNTLYKMWTSNVKILQRGCMVDLEETHELGMAAFPCILDVLEFLPDNMNMTTDFDTEEYLTEEETNVETMEIVANMIYANRSPAVTCIITSSI